MPEAPNSLPAGRHAGATAVPTAPVVTPTTVTEPRPPVASRRQHVSTLHGITRQDDWFWLREREDPEVRGYLEAENAYTESVMAPAKPLEDELYRELVARIQETDLSVPERDEEWLYYHRTQEGKQYPIYCRRRGSMEAPEEVLLDENVLAEGHAYFRLGALEVSPDHTKVAYAVDSSGSEEYTLRVRDIATGTDLPDTIVGAGGNLCWAADSSTLFYVVLDAAHRPWCVLRHRLGEDVASDTIAHQEHDHAFFVGVALSKSKRFVLLEAHSHTTSEAWFLPADEPEGFFRLVRPRVAGVEYDLADHGDRFFVVTNEGARNFQLVELPVADPSQPSKPVLPPSDRVKLDGLETFEQHLVVYEREDGLRQVRIIDLRSGEQHRVAFPEPVYTVRRHSNPDFRSRVVRFTYTSLVTPASVIDYDMDERTWTERKRTVVHGYDPAPYRSARAHATAPDGTSVPVSLVWKEPLALDGSRPMYLLGYGSYGSSYEPSFSSTYLSLLDRGFVVGIAHVRGGEELGRPWYDDGKLLRKKNTFSDFIACAEELIRQGYTSPDRLGIAGGSAGGLLMGAVANMRPDLFAVVVADVPFVDVVNTMLDATLPLTVIEYDEWGNPVDETHGRYMLDYSPYDNVRAQAYPHMLVTAGFNDPRVQYWEPAKWVAKLRATRTDDRRLLLKTNMGAGHAGASGRYDYLREVAFKYAFVLDTLGMAER
jgi:oligopeptidase B